MSIKCISTQSPKSNRIPRKYKPYNAFHWINKDVILNLATGFGGSCCLMDNLLGLLRIRVKRGINLVVRDFRSSDPYCVFKMGEEQRLKTHIIYGELNPVWDQDLTLSIEDPNLPIELLVFDHDTFTKDDEMGDAEFDIQSFMEALKMHLDPDTVPNGTILKRIEPSRSNCLSEESCVTWTNGQIVQNMLLRLRNVESGEIELELYWIDIPGAHPI